MRYYLVGGAVRDMLLGRQPKEYDIVFFGDREEFLCEHPHAQPVGLAHPIYLADGVEYSPARGESIQKDLMARDLTINAMALDQDGHFIAHERAVGDLRNKLLHPVSSHALQDDPARVFRAARLAAELPDFLPTAELLSAMREAAANNSTISLAPERVASEMLKSLGAPKPSRFFQLLQDTGNIEPWFAELASASEIPAGPAPYHQNTVLDHTLEVMDKLAGNPLHVWMGLVHDLGKTHTPENILPHHYSHEKRGEDMVESLATRLKLSSRHLKSGKIASRLHMQAGRYLELRPGTKVDLLVALDASGLTDAMARLVRADKGADIEQIVQRDLTILQSVSLPPEYQNLGPESGRRLRELRCQAISLQQH